MVSLSHRMNFAMHMDPSAPPDPGALQRLAVIILIFIVLAVWLFFFRKR
jgi:hypothetical protein